MRAIAIAEIFIHVPWIARLLELAILLGALPVLAGEVNANPLLQVSWEDVCGTGIELFQVEHSHLLFIWATSFDHLCLFALLRGCYFVGSTCWGNRGAFCVSTGSGVRWVCGWCVLLWEDWVCCRVV